MWVCLLYLWLLSHVLTWGILLFWFVFLKAVSQFFHLRTKGLMSVNGYGGDWITGPLRVVSSNWWIFEHMKSLWLLVFSVIEGGLFSCRHSMMSKVLERIQYFNLAFFFFPGKGPHSSYTGSAGATLGAHDASRDPREKHTRRYLRAGLSWVWPVLIFSHILVLVIRVRVHQAFWCFYCTTCENVGSIPPTTTDRVCLCSLCRSRTYCVARLVSNLW